jgi:hypothetical protein
MHLQINWTRNQWPFAWWVDYVHKKKEAILSKLKSKYWIHKYGTGVPKLVEHALKLDQQNGNTLWWDAIMQETATCIAFQKSSGTRPPIGFQAIKQRHMIFDIVKIRVFVLLTV